MGFSNLIAFRGRLFALPIARMGFAPLLRFEDTDRPAKVIAVSWQAQPLALTGLVAGALALRFGTILLSPPIAVVGKELNLAMQALARLGRRGHRPQSAAGQGRGRVRNKTAEENRKKESGGRLFE